MNREKELQTVFAKAISRIRMSSGIGIDISIALVVNLTLMGLGLFTGAFVARLLGPVGRGQIAAIQLWGMFLLSFGSLGIPQALLYYSGRYYEQAGEFITSAWLVMLPLSLVWMAAGYFGLPLLLEKQGPVVITFARMFLVILPMAYISRASWALHGLKKFRPWGIFQLHKPVLYTLALILIGIIGIASPQNITLTVILLSAVGPFLIIYLLKKNAIQLKQPSISKTKKLFNYGVRSVLGSLPEELNTRLDQIVIAMWLTDVELGYYVVAVSWSLMLSPVVRAIGSVLFPYIAANADQHAQIDLFTQSIRITTLLIILATLVLLIATPLLLPLVFGNEFRSSVLVALILLVASSFYHLKSVLSEGLRGLKFPEATAYAEIASLFVTGITLILLLPKIGILGAAIASLLAYFLSVNILTVFVLRKLAISFSTLFIINFWDLLQVKKNVLQRLGKIN